MGLFGIGNSTSPAAQAVSAAEASSGPATGGGVFPGQSALPGGMMAQSGTGSVIKKMLVGGVAGAGLGAGYGLLAGMVSFLPHVTVPMGALIGGAAGAALGLVKGLLDKRKANLAMRSQQAVQPGAGTAPVSVPRPATGRVLQPGASGPLVKWTQRALKNVGVYSGKVSGKLDDATQDAIRRYELLKGAMPSGSSTPELRTSLAQDIKLQRQFG